MEHAMDAFMPHGMCYLWRPDILILHVGSDLLIALAYFSIPAALLTFLRQRPDVRYPFIVWLFIGFILSCGVTHLMGVVVTWNPLYVVEGALKAVTAVLSVTTAIVLWPLIPRAARIPSPQMLEARNAEISALNEELTRRVASLSTLSGGVAHDFNNLLTIIIGNADMLRASSAEHSPEALIAIDQAAQRAAGLCRQMLAYSGRGHFVLAPVRIDDIVEDALDELGDPRPTQIDLEPRVPDIAAAPLQVRELVVELIRNAREAVAEAGGLGALSIATRLEHLDAETLRGAEFEHDLPPGDAVVLEIRDNGIGIDDDVRKRMFEPYFSTHFTGRGLGLAAVRGIVRGHHAALFLDSAPGRGTTLRVAFAAVTTPRESFRPRRTRLEGRRRILILDDEPGLLRLAADYCERLGFDPVTTTDPDEALATLRREGETIGAVILDFLMPERTGPEVLEELRTFSDVDVFLTSGFTRGEEHDPQLMGQLAGFLPKPFRFHDFRRLLSGD